ncbi:hypothetical protein CVT24_000412 [Panaeolus cyanescens]|uniref:Reverse transcriptase domain-containing protein n=1 Tax=Panaeolus cyanescens TaxID=181874 RepID=A0A409YDP8_9AGAR|nr:hypothetical protein CVT24_000412 [Panaeolus cyanescens]
MPPVPNVRFPDTISKMNKVALVAACTFLNLPSHGTVVLLRNRLITWARAHRDEYQNDPEYAGFYRTKGVRQQQVAHHDADEEESIDQPDNSDNEEEQDEQQPPPPPPSEHSFSSFSGIRSQRSESNPSEHDERSVSPERSLSHHSSHTNGTARSHDEGSQPNDHGHRHSDTVMIVKIGDHPTHLTPSITIASTLTLGIVGFKAHSHKMPIETMPMAVDPLTDASSVVPTITIPAVVLKPPSPTENLCSYHPNKTPNTLELTETVVPTVSHGTAKTPSVKMDVAPAVTLAPSVEIKSTTLNAAPSPPPSLLPVVTCLVADAWELALIQAGKFDEFRDIPDGIRNGFDLGTRSATPSVTYIPPNHTSAISHPNAVISNIHTELANRRYTGPFSPDRLENLIGPFRTSPLGVVPKNGSDQFRLVQNFSFPYDDPLVSSVNNNIDTTNLFCDWGTFQRAADIVRNAPPNTLAATLDVDSAFRRCPIHPSQQRNFVVSWMGLCYIDHCTPFGARSSGFIFGRIADAFTTILQSNKIGPVINWVDDFAFFNYPSPTFTLSCPIYTYSLDSIYSLASSLGWPWKLSKTTPFHSTFKYLGFLWNLISKTVEIPEEKKTKYLSKLTRWPRHTPKSPLLTTTTVMPFPSITKLTSSSLSSLKPYLSPSDIANLQDALSLSWAPRTLKSYSSAVKEYTNFCKRRAIPHYLQFPAHETALCAFAASFLGQYSISTVRNKLSGLKSFHVAHNMQWNESPRLKAVLRGIQRATPSSSIRPKRQPITTSMLTKLISQLNPHDSLDVCVAACATTAFWGQCRLGELLPTSASISHPNIRDLPSRSHLRRSASSKHRNSFFKLYLPKTKTQFKGDVVILNSRTHNSNPLPLLRRHLAVNQLPSNTPLFAYCPSDEYGTSFRVLTKRHFLSRCNKIWSSLGYARVTGHAFRIGGTTKLLSSGVPPDVVKATGRWSSDSFLRYWRNIGQIARAQEQPSNTS